MHMKRFLIPLLFLVLMAPLQAQNLGKVLDNYFRANQTARIAEEKSMYVQATMEQGGMSIPMKVYYKRPDKIRVEFEFQGRKALSVVNGEKGWNYMPWMSPDPQPLPGPQIEQLKEQYNMEGDLWNYKEKGNKVRLDGKEKVDGRTAYKVVLDKKSGTRIVFFIDADTYLVSRMESFTSKEGKEYHTITRMENYKDFNGFMQPTLLSTTIEGVPGKLIVRMEELRIGEEMPDSLFRKPGN